MKAAHVGEAAARVREERLLALDRLGSHVRSLAVDFVLVAGDVFEDNGVDRSLVQAVADKASFFGVPVYIIPGNHDSLVPGSVWDHPAWKSARNVHVLRDERPVEVPGGVLFPCPLLAKRSSQDPTAWIPPGPGHSVRIGLAHGTVEGIRQDEPDYPISRQAAQRANLDYLALGHWHSTAVYADGGVPRMAYSGTHEPTGFGERDSGNVLLVKINPGQPPQIAPQANGGLKWLQIDDELRSAGDLAGLRARLEALDKPGSTLVNVRLFGLLAAADREELAHIADILKASRFLYSRLDTSHLYPSPQDDTWIEALPAGLLRDIAARLRDLSNPSFSGRRPEGGTPTVAARALLELYAVAAGVLR